MTLFRIMIIDTHIHNVKAFKWNNLYRGCLIPKPESFNDVDIENLNNLIKQEISGRDEITCFASVNPENGVPEVDRAVRELGFKGLALDTEANFKFSHDAIWRLFEEIHELDVPVFIHSEPDRINFDLDEVNEAIISFPDVNFIFAHLGIRKGEDFIRIVPETNAFFETSNISGDFITETLENITCDRLVFGSNAEKEYPLEEIHKINSLPISEDDKHKILFSNMADILDLKLPEDNPKEKFGSFVSRFITKFQ